MGDDRTDEDLFAALPEHCVGFKVGDGPTLATRRLRDPSVVRDFLRDLVRNCGARTSGVAAARALFQRLVGR